jgi:uncharacterized protein YcnI
MPGPTRSKLIGATLVATAVLLALALPASAHVEAEGETAASGLTTVTFSFEHGCGESPTTSLKVELPADTSDVTPQDPDGWTSAVTAGTLTWSGGSIPATSPGTFVVDMRIVGTAGDTVFLPTIQGCAEGENAWIERTDDPEADDAAPRITLTETVAPVSSADTPTTAGASTSTTSATDASAEAAASDAKIVDDSTSSPVGTIVLVAVLAVIVVGAVVLYLRNRRPKPSAP